jgi:oligoendopeptidase F
MFDLLPPDAKGTIDWSWSKFEPYYTELAKRKLDEDNAPVFLADWSRIVELVDETYSRLYVATTVNTADEEAKNRFHRFLDEIYPKTEQAEQILREKIVRQSKTPDGFEVPLRRLRQETELFRQENIPLKAEEQKQCIEYDKIIGSQTVMWEGKETTIMQLRPVYQSADRDLREKAWRMAAQRQLEDREAIAGLWGKFMGLRLKIAENAGCDDYRSYRWREMHRFDYSPDDCKAFHKAIEESVVPAAERIAEKRRRKLGLKALRPWDLEVDPQGRPPLKPFADVSELKSGVSAIFHRIEKSLGGYFDKMAAENLLDLDNRKNKAPGGYCVDFAAARKPFIFMNAVGVHDDVQTLLHECGHCFHTFLRSSLPYYHQRQVGLEFSEVASMTMELLAGAHLDKNGGGFYSRQEAARASVEHLEKSVQFWPYMAVADSFQHWVYENPEAARDIRACDEQWMSLFRRFVTWIDWTGLEEQGMSRWHRQSHIHVMPFYYVEYGLAQLGAVQIWGNGLKNQAAAIASYLGALALGGAVPLPELFSTAGAKFAFDPLTLSSAVKQMEAMIDKLTEA